MRYGLGMCSVFEIMRAAQNAKMTETQCISKGVLTRGATRPPGRPLPGPSIKLRRTHTAMHNTKARELGIGRPSKYCDLPVLSFGRRATVALNRARRAIPQQMKEVRTKMSAVLRSPIAKPRKAGATPKEICRSQTDKFSS